MGHALEELAGQCRALPTSVTLCGSFLVMACGVSCEQGKTTPFRGFCRVENWRMNKTSRKRNIQSEKHPTYRHRGVSKPGMLPETLLELLRHDAGARPAKDEDAGHFLTLSLRCAVKTLHVPMCHSHTTQLQQSDGTQWVTDNHTQQGTAGCEWEET